MNGCTTLLLLCCWLVVASYAASRRPTGSHEREEDGAWSPRDKHHYDGEEHDDQFDHESILGSHKEAEEFDELPPEEAKARLALLAEKMDKDKDNVISKEELKQWIMKSFKMLSREESDERWEEANENEDERVSWKELLVETYDIKSEDELPADNPDDLKLMKEDRALFNAADADKDGSLDIQEFQSFTHPEEHDHMQHVLIDNALVDKDLNKDGVVDLTEFLGADANQKGSEWLSLEKEKFNSHDVDKDGKLNRQEVLRWVMPSNDEVALDEVEHLFSSADDNHDLVLSMEEVLQHHDVFVGSEATDFGDHLNNIDRFHEEL